MEGEPKSLVETMTFRISSLHSLVTILASVDTSGQPGMASTSSLSKHEDRIRMALTDATEKCRLAILNLQQVISPPILPLYRLCQIVDKIMEKKKKSTWWFLERFYYKKAQTYLRDNVKCDQIMLDASCDTVLLQGFEDAAAAYASVINLCTKYSRRGTSMFLQKVCSAAVAILRCANVGLQAVQLYSLVTAMPGNATLMTDTALQDLINDLKNKRNSLRDTDSAIKQLNQKTEEEIRTLYANTTAALVGAQSVEGDLSYFCECVREACSSTRKVSVLLDPTVHLKLHKLYGNLFELRKSCDELQIATQKVLDIFSV